MEKIAMNQCMRLTPMGGGSPHCQRLAMFILGQSHPHGEVRLCKIHSTATVGQKSSGLGQKSSGPGLNNTGLGLNNTGLGLNSTELGLNNTELGLNKTGVNSRLNNQNYKLSLFRSTFDITRKCLLVANIIGGSFNLPASTRTYMTNQHVPSAFRLVRKSGYPVICKGYCSNRRETVEQGNTQDEGSKVDRSSEFKLNRRHQSLGDEMSQSRVEGTSQSEPGEKTQSEVEGSLQSADVASVTQTVITSGSRVDKMVLSIPQHRVRDQVRTLLSHGLTADEVTQLLLQRSELLKLNKLKHFLSVLLSYQFSPSDVGKVLRDVPSLSYLKQIHIQNVFDCLRQVGMTEDRSRDVVVREPSVLGLDSESIQVRISNLKMLFKTEDVLRAVWQTPSILVCEWDSVEKKFHYVHSKMNVSQRQILYTQLFDYPLNHVRCRHEFLVRAGLFGMDKVSKDSNPRLQDIIDTSDSDFVKTFGGMRVEEYETFCKLMSKSSEDVKFEEML